MNFMNFMNFRTDSFTCGNLRRLVVMFKVGFMSLCVFMSVLCVAMSVSPLRTIVNFMSVSEYLCVSPVKCLCVFIDEIQREFRR